MYYRNKLGYSYPNKCDEHMLPVKHVHDVNIDEHYSYIDTSFSFKFKQFWLRTAIYAFVFPLLRIVNGLKIHGKKILKQNKSLLKNGAITISNHVFMWDYLCVLRAIYPHFPHFPAWKTNFEGPNGPLIKLIGGIPVPTDNFPAMHIFKSIIDNELNSNKWIHFFPEGSLWFYYPDIRPLKPAVFKFAAIHNKPIIPLSFSFRKRRGLHRLFRGKNIPCVDLHIGTPIFPNTELGIKEAADEMQKEAYHVMQVMAGIKPGDPTYNTNQNLTEYKKTM